MQVNPVSASQRPQAPEPAQAPRAAQPPEQPTSGAQPVARPTLATGPSSAFAQRLDEALRAVRTRLDESGLNAGLSFRAPVYEARSDVLRIQPVDAAPPERRPTPIEPADQSALEDAGEAGSRPLAEPAPAPPSVNRTAPASGGGRPAAPAPAFDRTEVAPGPPEPAPANPAADPARQLGDATLGSLAGATALQAAAGRFQIDVNGQAQTFRVDQPLSDLVSRLSGPASGTQASLDPRGQLVVQSTTGEELSISDRRGNLSGGLGIEVTPSENTNATLTRDLQDFAGGINRAINLIESELGQTAETELQAVLRDLEAALSSLFTPSGDGSLQGLGDLGFSRAGGEVMVDRSRLQDLVASRTDEVNQVVTAVRGSAQPVLQGGERVAQAIDSSLPDARRATQEVRVRLEVARLQVRQQTLTLDRMAAEGLRQRVAQQSEALGRIAEALVSQVPSGLPDPSEQAVDFARGLPETRPRQRPAAAYRLPVPNVFRGSVMGSGA
ncbi:MAG: hypothetical protein VKQ33_02590 [Candidatus Sericytochromatia bacterium]|nr:hypothetical protein [Candidatus Sericytochromatia bacterium]